MSPSGKAGKGIEFGRSCRKILAIGVSIVVLSGCIGTFFDPYIHATTEADKYREDRTYEDALKYAQAQKEAYYGAISDHAVLNSGVGTILIPLAAFAAYKGFTDPNTHQLLALGTAGAGVYGLGGFHYSKPRQLIYGASVTAIDCIISSLAPITDANIDEKSDNVLTGSASKLIGLQRKFKLALEARNKIGSKRAYAITNAFMDQIDQELRETKQSIADGKKARRILKRSANTLYSAIERVRGEATFHLLRTEPDLQSLVASLGTAVPLTAGLFLNRDVQSLATANKGGEGTTRNKDGGARTKPDFKKREAAERIKELTDSMEEVRSLRVLVDDRVELVGLGPSKDVLENCNVDPEHSGVTFALNPAGDLDIDLTSSRQGAVEITGGKFPYAANWRGMAPKDDEVKLEVDLQSNGDGLVKIKIEDGKTPKGTFVLSVRDSAKGRAELAVTFSTPIQDSGGGVVESEELTDPAGGLPGTKFCTSAVNPLQDPPGDAEKTAVLKKAMDRFVKLAEVERPKNCGAEADYNSAAPFGPISQSYLVASLEKAGCTVGPSKFTYSDVLDALNKNHDALKSGAKIPDGMSCPEPVSVAKTSIVEDVTQDESSRSACNAYAGQNPIDDMPADSDSVARFQTNLKSFVEAAGIERPEGCAHSASVALSTNGEDIPTTIGFLIESLQRLGCATEPKMYSFNKVVDALINGISVSDNGTRGIHEGECTLTQ